MKHSYNANEMQHVIIYHENQKPQIKNFKKNLKKPKKFQKLKKSRSRMHELMKRLKIRTLTKCFGHDLGRKCSGLGDLRVRKSFWVERESFLLREK